MKTDDDSEDAEKPPGNNSGNREKSVADVDEANEELEWAWKHVPKGTAHQPEPTPASASHGNAELAFRKTEFWNRAPLIKSEEVVRQKGLDGQADEIHERIDNLEDRIELVIYRLENRISKLEEKRRS
jgi:hypothetical protein